VICAGNDVSDMYMTLAAARRLVHMSPMGVLVIRGDCSQAPRHLFSALKKPLRQPDIRDRRCAAACAGARRLTWHVGVERSRGDGRVSLTLDWNLVSIFDAPVISQTWVVARFSCGFSRGLSAS
jgi:hypothetical protein